MSLKQKIFLWTVLPLMLAMVGIGSLLYTISSELSKQHTATLQKALIDAKKAELRYYTAFASNSIANIYHGKNSQTPAAKRKAMEIINQLSYGPDGYFFVYDFKGNNIVHPRQAFRVGKNWIGLKDQKGNFVIKDLIAAAKSGGDYTQYVWEKPSSGKLEPKIGYAIGLEKWGWMLGTGMYVDNITSKASVLGSDIAASTTRTFLGILVIVLSSLALVAGAGIFLTLQQHRQARDQLKRLNQKILETQENERTRVARELHDGISQQLSSIKYVFELAQIHQARNNTKTKETISKGITGLGSAISEIRRISKDLRPGALDDLGLSPALKTLAQEFSDSTGLNVKTEIVPVASRLGDNEKTALFRIAQEALTNIARHANAKQVQINLKTDNKKVTLTIRDDGKGFDQNKAQTGIGLKNMSERMAFYGGAFALQTNATGTTVTASIAANPASNINPITWLAAQ